MAEEVCEHCMFPDLQDNFGDNFNDLCVVDPRESISRSILTSGRIRPLTRGVWHL